MALLPNLIQCNTCGGQYSQIMPDGTLYFHSCPPGTVSGVGVGQALPGSRNENLVLTPSGQAIGIVSQGTGVTVLQGQFYPPAGPGV